MHTVYSWQLLLFQLLYGVVTIALLFSLLLFLLCTACTAMPAWRVPIAIAKTPPKCFHPARRNRKRP